MWRPSIQRRTGVPEAYSRLRHGHSLPLFLFPRRAPNNDQAFLVPLPCSSRSFSNTGAGNLSNEVEWMIFGWPRLLSNSTYHNCRSDMVYKEVIMPRWTVRSQRISEHVTSKARALDPNAGQPPSATFGSYFFGQLERALVASGCRSSHRIAINRNNR